MSIIIDIYGRQIIDSRGNPTVEVRVTLDSGATGRADLERLDLLMQGRTSILISHRVSTLAGVDRIVVLDDGRIVAVGNHEELIRSNELYARLAELQFGEAQ